MTRNCCKGSVHHPASPDRLAVYMLFIFNFKFTWRFRNTFLYEICILRVKNLQQGRIQDFF